MRKEKFQISFLQRKRVFLFGLFITFCSIFSIGQTTLWLEEFPLPDGTKNDAGATAWSRDTTQVPINGHFSVQSNQFEGNFIEDGGQNNEAIWISESININGYSNVSVSVDVSSAGTGSGDWIRGTYEIDGVGETEFFYNEGSFAVTTENVSGRTGNSIIVRIYARNGAATEYHYFDNIHVYDEPVTRYAIKSDNWNDPTTWSYTSGGGTCNCIPNDYSETFTDGNSVTIDANSETRDLTVDAGDAIDFSGAYSLTINNGGTVTINNGSTIDRNGNNADLIFDNGTDFILEVDDNSPGLNIEEILIEDINSLLIRGTGDINVSNDFELRQTGATITNNLEGTISIFDDIRFLNDDNKIINSVNSTITVSGGATSEIYFGFRRATIENNGEINQSGNFTYITSGEVQCYNFQDATWNIGGASPDTDIELFCSYDNNTFNYSRFGNQDIITPEDAYWHIELSGSGSKSAQGDFDVKGDWTNNNVSFIPGSGMVTFNGTTDQTISKSGSIEYFNDFTLDKSAGTLFLDDNVTITDDFYLAGIIDVNSNRFLMSSSNAIDLTYASGYIKGKFERAVLQSGADYLFPVGASNYNPVSLDFGNITNGSLTIQFVESDPLENSEFPLDDAGAVVDDRFDDGYWEMTPDGSFASTDIDITVNATGFVNYPVSSTTRLLYRSGLNWDVSGDHTDASVPEVYRNTFDAGITGVTDFGLGYSCTPTITLGSNPAVCSGATSANLSYSATTSSPDRYSINFNAAAEAEGFTDVVLAALTASPIVITVPGAAANGVYNANLLVNNSTTGCSSGNYAITVTVVAQPVANDLTKDPVDATVCAGQTLTVTAAGASGGTGAIADEYRYSTDNGAIWSVWGAALPSFAAVASDDNLIQSRRTADGTGCSTSATKEVSWAVVAQPVANDLTKDPVDATVCAGQTLTVTAAGASGGTGAIADEYRYSTDNGAIWSAWGAALPSFAAVASDDNLIQSRRTADGTGCSTSATKEVSWAVVAQPVANDLTKDPVDATVCAGQTLTVTAAGASGGTGAIADEYRYSTDNGAIWSAWGAALPSFAAVASDDNLIQSRRTADGTGCSTSATKEVSWAVVAQPVANDLTKDPVDATVCAGQTLTVTAAGASGGTGAIADEYRYSTDNGAIWSAWGAALPSFAAVASDDNLIQSRRTADGTGCSTSATKEVSWAVVAQPVANDLTKDPVDATVCAGQTLTVTAAGASGGTGAIADEYRYSTDNGAIWSAWGAALPSFAAVASDDNLIQSRRTADGTGCSTSATKEVSWAVVAQPVANAGPNIFICGVDNGTLDADPPGVGSGQWVIIPGSENITINDPLDPKSDFTVTIGAFSTYQIEWVVTNSICIDRDTTIIAYSDSASAGFDQYLCDTLSTNLDGNSLVLDREMGRLNTAFRK